KELRLSKPTRPSRAPRPGARPSSPLLRAWQRIPRALRWLGVAGAALVVCLFVARKLWRAYKNRPLPVAIDPSFRLGYNLDFPGDWSHLVPFVDQMKAARAFVGSCSDADPGCDPAAHLDLDPAGWVKSLRYKHDPSLAYAHVETIFNTAEGRYDAGRPY